MLFSFHIKIRVFIKNMASYLYGRYLKHLNRKEFNILKNNLHVIEIVIVKSRYRKLLKMSLQLLRKNAQNNIDLFKNIKT